MSETIGSEPLPGRVHAQETTTSTGGPRKSQDVEVTHLLESSTVKNQLYRQEPRLPTIPLPGVSLVATTSMLFLKDLLERAVQNSDSDLVDASLIRRTVQENPSLSFLETALEGVNDSTPPREFRPTNSKRKRSASTLTTSNKKSIAEATSALQDQEIATAVPGVSTEIVVDDDDYD